MGETRVDLLHLLEDLRDAYPGSLEETILTEVMANALDSGASRISFESNPIERTLAVVDNGSGMQRRDLARYHDVAASSKVRGQGIGFAGVGIKLGLLACEEVLTETKRGKSHVASSWHIASRHRAPWKWIPPPGLVEDRGTGVRLKLRNPLSPLLDPGFLEEMLRRHFQPLFDPAFGEFLALHYPKGIAVAINGRRVQERAHPAAQRALLEIRLMRKRKPSALGYLIRDERPLPDEERGLAISTLGKVIRRGWEWLGISATAPERTGGVIEVPELAACLTLNKGDFIRTGARGATYLSFRKAIQQAVARQLAEWGDAQPSTDNAPPREVRPLQRDLAYLLEDLAEDFPLLASLVEHRANGQKRLPLGEVRNGEGASAFLAASIIRLADRPDEAGETEVSGKSSPGEKPTVREDAPPYAATSEEIQLPSKPGRRRPGHYGLQIQFEDRPEATSLGRLVESTVWVNRAHPAYARALASRSIGYHIALSVALSLAPLAVEPAYESQFLLRFLTRWGEAVQPQRTQRKLRS
jgi:hypothetical protein